MIKNYSHLKIVNCKLKIAVFALSFFLLTTYYFLPTTASAAFIKPVNNLGLVGWWPMDEGAGTVAHDFSGNKKNGVLINTPTWSSGQRGKALNFSYVAGNQRVDLGDNFDFPSGSSFTICAWAYPTDELSDGYIAGKFSGAGWWLRRFGNNWQGDADINNNLVIVDGAKINNWAHLCFVLNPNPGTSVLYYNGKVGATSTNVPSPADNATSATIGNRGDSARAFGGKIDDVRFYNRAITAGEVLSLYQNNSSSKIGGTNVGQDLLSNGLVGWWTMDGKDMNWTTGRLTDLSVSGNMGIVSGMATSTAPVTGRIGQALNFNGTTSQINLGNASVLNAPTSYTLNVWINPRTTGGAGKGRIYDKQGGGATGLQIYVDSTGSGSQISIDHDATHILSNSGILLFNQWWMLSVVWNGSNATFYRNGVQFGSSVALSTAITTNTITARLGGRESANDRQFDGAIDDLRFYNRALSTSEVAKLYQSNTVTKKNVSNNGLIGWWPLDEGAGTIAHDFSGKGNSGTLTNGPIWASGKRGKSISFDGVDDRIQTPLNFSGLSSFTVSQWVYATNPDAYETLWSSISSNNICNSGNGGDGLFFGGPTYLYFRAAEVYTEGTVPNISNKWTHVVSTYNATNRRVYFDNVVVMDAAGGSPTTGYIPFQIGDYNDCVAPSPHFTGFIDDTRIYNRVLSAGEIMKLYNGSN